MQHTDLEYQTNMFIMLGNKCQTLCNQPGACDPVGSNMWKIMSKEEKPFTHCVHNPHLQTNIIEGKKNIIHICWQQTVLFHKLCKLSIDMYCCRSCQKQCWFKVLKAAHSAAQVFAGLVKQEWEPNEISGTTTLSMANSRVLIVKFTTIKSEQQAMCCYVYTNKFWHEWS